MGEPLLPKGVKVDFYATAQSKRKVTASDLDQFDDSTKSITWCAIDLDASEAMVALVEQAPDQSTGWKDMTNRLPEPWWQFAYLLFHRDPRLDDLAAEHDGIIQRFRKHVLLMTHNLIRKNGTRALALIDRKPGIANVGGILTCNFRCDSRA